ncbi:MAG: hypothetical protein V3V61_07120 [Gammaproteobacteria bacterium]
MLKEDPEATEIFYDINSNCMHRLRSMNRCSVSNLIRITGEQLLELQNFIVQDGAIDAARLELVRDRLAKIELDPDCSSITAQEPFAELWRTVCDQERYIAFKIEAAQDAEGRSKVADAERLKAKKLKRAAVEKVEVLSAATVANKGAKATVERHRAKEADETATKAVERATEAARVAKEEASAAAAEVKIERSRFEENAPTLSPGSRR